MIGSRREEWEERERAFGDAVYNVWMRGGNPDIVDRDDIDDAWYGDGERDRYTTSKIVADQTIRRQRRR